MRTYIKDLSAGIGQEVTVCGWIDVRRDQGKMVFLDLRDVTGKVQAVVLPNHIGDMVLIDVRGVVEIKDCIKDVIKIGGEWISLLDLENLIS